MQKDYSEYVPSEQEQYQLHRRGNEFIDFEYFNNRARFNPERRTLDIQVNGKKVSMLLTIPRYLRVGYEFSRPDQILELEFTKLLESDVRFRKCQRCGRYFILKGNFNPRYCDRVEEWCNRTCRELAAQENFKEKAAGSFSTVFCQKAEHDQSDSKPYPLSSEVIRLTNAINCGLKHSDAPHGVL